MPGTACAGCPSAPVRSCWPPPGFSTAARPQYTPPPIPEPQQATTTAARAWALGRPDRPISLRELAAQESMSVRTSPRRFRAEVGVSPGQWLTQQRVERARHLLEGTDLS